MLQALSVPQVITGIGALTTSYGPFKRELSKNTSVSLDRTTIKLSFPVNKYHSMM